MENKSKTPAGSKQICIPCSEEKYNEILGDKSAFKKYLDEIFEQHPEIFPFRTDEGFSLNGFQRTSDKLGIRMRRIIINATGEVFNIRPSFVLPYMTERTVNVEKAIFFRRFNVPYWALTCAYGRNDMFWYRLEMSFGRNSIVGTTVKDPECLPKDLTGDEKHTRLNGEKVYIATTAGGDCILGASVAASAGTEDLTKAYGVFQSEALDVDPEYSPDTVNIDGWEPTRQAWKNLFPLVTVILCFLHAFLSIKRCCTKKARELLNEIGDKVWNVYEAKAKPAFSQRIRRLREWADNLKPGVVKDKILSLCDKKDEFIKAYDFPGAHRTSNMIDRMMKWQDEYLFNRKYFHGTLESAETAIRAWAVLRNFQPYCSRVNGADTELTSAAGRLNGFQYSENWLENLLVSASMCGYRQ